MAPDKLLAEWFWVDRWVGSSAFALPIDARGLYREMLSQAWRRGAQLPNNAEQIRRMTGVTVKEWNKAWPLVTPYWRADGLILVNETQLEVYADAVQRSLRASERALKGVQARLEAQRKLHAGSTQAPLKLDSSSTQVPTQVATQAPLESQPPSLSPSPIVVSSKPQTEHVAEVARDALDRRAGHLVERYAELFYVHRKGARYHSRIHLDFLKAQELVRTWTDDARLEKLAIIILDTDDEWISRTDRGFAIFAAKATWADDRLKAWELEHGLAGN